jgi:glycosyltransferase involved in cell wall biosynthesis
MSFLGWQPHADVLATLAVADVLVLPTWHPEGFPVAVLEAMAAGLAVVTTRVGGMPDLLRQGQHVLYVPPRAPEILAENLLLILRNGDLRARMGHANRELIAQFEPRRAMEEPLAFMRARVAGSRKASRV